MKMSYLARLVGLDPRMATESGIKTELERMATRANIASEGTPGTPSPATSIYSTSRIAADTDSDISRSTEPYIIRTIRPGHWQIFERQADGSYRKFGVESIGLDDLKAQAKKLNDKARAKASQPIANEVAKLVEVEMQATHCSYDLAWMAVKEKNPVLFANLRESPAQRERTARRK